MPAPHVEAPLPAPTGPQRVLYPQAVKHPTTRKYGSLEIKDDYAWLEDGSAKEVDAWSDEENALTRRRLDGSPSRAAIHDRVAALLGDASTSWGGMSARHGVVFALEDHPPKQHPYLIALPANLDPSKAHVVVDPNAIDPSGGTAIGFYTPSPDGKRVAVSLAKGGNEIGDVHIFDVATGKEEKDVLPNGGSVDGSTAWTPDGKGFYYMRFAQAAKSEGQLGSFQQVWLHVLGTSKEKDTLALGKDAPSIAQWDLDASDDGQTIVARMAYGDGGEFDQWVLAPHGKWTQVSSRKDGVTAVKPGPGGALFLLSVHEASKGKVLRTSAAKPDLAHAEMFVPEGDAVIKDLVPTRTRLYLLEEVDGVSRLVSAPLAGKGAQATLPTPPISAVRSLVAAGGDDVLFDVVTYTDPAAIYRASGKDGSVEKTPLASKSHADFSGIEVVRESCKSKDGTDVPLTVLRPKGLALEGKAPALLTGYGGFGISVLPRYRAQTLAWLEQGGVYAVANLRGGGERGEAWHLAGNLTHKQNVFDDFYACAQHLVDAHYTRPDRLAIEGGSNGGLLMGAEITQHPDAFKAVVAHVGIYDMLQLEHDPNGAFNVTEYGSSQNPDELAALAAYSPYHAVKTGTPYPSALFMTGKNDPRVMPYHSRKMVARLQAATSGAAPILLRTSGNTGHGVGSPLNARIDEATDVYVFLADELGMRWGGPTKERPGPR